MTALLAPAALDDGFFGQMARGLLSNMELDTLSSGVRDRLSEVLKFVTTAEAEIAKRHERTRRLEGLAIIDDVTGLENQRGLQTAFDRAVAASERYAEQGILIVFAIGGLEDINARFGNSAEVLMVRAVAQTLRSQIRQSDIPSRLSRDEFAVLLPRCPAEIAAPKAAGIAQALALLGVSFGDSLLTIDPVAGTAPFGRGSLFDHCLGAAHHAVARALSMAELPSSAVAQIAATH
jgi:diguanylate cyclase (GGDEF)-like protein